MSADSAQGYDVEVVDQNARVVQRRRKAFSKLPLDAVAASRAPVSEANR